MSHDHPFPVKATQQQVKAHPELRHGTRMDNGSTWVSSLTNMLACCPESVCELVDRTASYQFPVVHEPGFDCPNHRTKSVECRRCGARGWELCRTQAGGLAAKPHKGRVSPPDSVSAGRITGR